MKIKLQKEVLKHFREIFIQAKSELKDNVKKTGLTGSQLWIMQQIYNFNGISNTELAKNLTLHVSTCSILVNKLIKKGLVEKTRSSTDERKIVLTISLKGKQLMAKAPKSPEGAIPSTLKKLNIEELEELNTVLTKFAKKMKVLNKVYKDIPLDY
ncbi:MAG: MarR family winged helix-turn-helix transcriptional regulator [Candidatus Methylopumilus sp.]|jgi:DNA-binding MarR family transcriptional regulator